MFSDCRTKMYVLIRIYVQYCLRCYIYSLEEIPYNTLLLPFSHPSSYPHKISFIPSYSQRITVSLVDIPAYAAPLKPARKFSIHLEPIPTSCARAVSFVETFDRCRFPSPSRKSEGKTKCQPQQGKRNRAIQEGATQPVQSRNVIHRNNSTGHGIERKKVSRLAGTAIKRNTRSTSPRPPPLGSTPTIRAKVKV